MLIRVGYDIEFNLPSEATLLAMLNVHPSRSLDLLEPDEIRTEPELLVSNYFDSFGNRCTRFVAPAGKLRLTGSTLVLDSGKPDAVKPTARECPVGDLPEADLASDAELPAIRLGAGGGLLATNGAAAMAGMAAAADANRALSIAVLPIMRPVAKAPLKASPAAVVSTTST